MLILSTIPDINFLVRTIAIICLRCNLFTTALTFHGTAKKSRGERVFFHSGETKSKISTSIRKHFIENPNPVSKEKRYATAIEKYKLKTKNTDNRVQRNSRAKGNVRLKKNNSYEAFIPASCSFENKRKSLEIFPSQESAQYAIDLYFLNYVKDTEIWKYNEKMQTLKGYK